MIRDVVVMLWGGPLVVARLRFAPGDVEAWTDERVTRYLRAYGITAPATEPERTARMAAYPQQADLDAIATAHTAANDGVRPVVRVLERSSHPSAHGLLGAAGSSPGAIIRA